MSCFAEHATQVRYKGREQWLERRRSGIGASDIAAVLGLSPYTTALQVWSSKLVEMPDSDHDESMMWGRRLEPVVLDAWQAERGYRVVHRGALVRSRAHPWMMATLDGAVRVNLADVEAGDLSAVRRAPAGVQAKITGEWQWSEVPQHYQLQVQWEMAVTGFELTFVVVLHGGRRLDTYEVPADPVVQAELIDAGKQFWQLVELGEPPPIEAGDLAFVNELFPRSIEQAVEIPADAADELYESRRAFLAARDRKDEAEAAVKAMLAESDTAVVGQQVIATWKTNKRRGLDVGRLRADLPAVADRYTVVGSERRFLVKGEEK